MFDVCVLGSLNMDLVINVDNIPKVGETVLANDFNKFPGGKGANQAVSAARLGAETVMIGAIGIDDNGNMLLNNLKADKIETKNIQIYKDVPTGVALITVDSNGNNIISVYPGANMKISEEDIINARDIIINSRILVAQFETPIDATIKAFELAKKNNVITILNPAPAKKIPKELLKLTDIIIPNESETYAITGIEPDSLENIKSAGEYFLDNDVMFVVITLGSKGAAIISRDSSQIIDAYRVNAVDTTAAGDSFIGGISYYLSNVDKLNFNVLKEAVKFANKVSSITVTKRGAQTSLPYINEVIEKYGEDIL